MVDEHSGILGRPFSVRLLESRLKAKFVAVKCDGLIDVADDEER